MAWEKFELFGGSFTPKITIRSTGHIGFSAGALNRFSIKEYEHCELFYDKDNRLVGLKLSNDYVEGKTTKIIKREIDCFITAKPFLEYYGIEYKPTKSYHGKKDEEVGMIVLDLKNPVIVHSKKSKRSGRKEEDVE